MCDIRMCGGQRSASGVLLSPAPYFLRHSLSLSLNLEHTIWTRLAGERALRISLAPVLGLEVCSITPSFRVDAGNLNLGPFAYSSEHFTHLALPLAPEETCSNGLPALGAGCHH